MVPERQALPAVADFSIEENAALAVNYLTEWVALMDMARLRLGDLVLVTAVAGGVGTAAVQITTRFGCATAGMAGSDAKLEAILALGAEAAVSYRRPDFAERLKTAAGPDGFDVVLDLVGGEVFHAVWPVLAPFGRVVVVGFASLALQRWNPLSWLRTYMARPSEGRHPFPGVGVIRLHGHAYRLPPQ